MVVVVIAVVTHYIRSALSDFGQAPTTHPTNNKAKNICVAVFFSCFFVFLRRFFRVSLLSSFSFASARVCPVRPLVSVPLHDVTKQVPTDVAKHAPHLPSYLAPTFAIVMCHKVPLCVPLLFFPNLLGSSRMEIPTHKGSYSRLDKGMRKGGSRPFMVY